ncbi:hypothetical protein EVAR_49883_1 [Eumeta japonica]|uniref:Uncharacterized protein n=1 Tax=Eumeta variegata TaxID=151549 RepID=A0A4C1XU58_EUMVA|nr:hypothetical protein EVAR_49883_1 [Eumeta japonica]
MAFWHSKAPPQRDEKIDLANFLAVAIFNDGFHIQRDDSRIKQAEIRHASSSKEERTARRQALASQQAICEEEGVLCGPGIVD